MNAEMQQQNHMHMQHMQHMQQQQQQQQAFQRQQIMAANAMRQQAAAQARLSNNNIILKLFLFSDYLSLYNNVSPVINKIRLR